jgi:hypothetical protein
MMIYTRIIREGQNFRPSISLINSCLLYQMSMQFISSKSYSSIFYRENIAIRIYHREFDRK